MFTHTNTEKEMTQWWPYTDEEWEQQSLPVKPK